MTTFLVSLVIVGLCVLGMCFNIIFRKKDFPHYDVGSNEEMRKRGIRCFKDEDAALHSRINCDHDCANCVSGGLESHNK